MTADAETDFIKGFDAVTRLADRNVPAGNQHFRTTFPETTYVTDFFAAPQATVHHSTLLQKLLEGIAAFATKW